MITEDSVSHIWVKLCRSMARTSGMQGKRQYAFRCKTLRELHREQHICLLAERVSFVESWSPDAQEGKRQVSDEPEPSSQRGAEMPLLTVLLRPLLEVDIIPTERVLRRKLDEMTRYSDDTRPGPSLSETGQEERRQEERAKVVSSDLGLKPFWSVGYSLV